MGSWCVASGSGFRARGSESRMQDGGERRPRVKRLAAAHPLGRAFRNFSLGFRDWDLRVGVWALGFWACGVRVRGSGFGVWGLGLWVVGCGFWGVGLGCGN